MQDVCGGEGDYVCHHAGVGQIETEVLTHTKEFLPTFVFLKFITSSSSSCSLDYTDKPAC